MNTKRKGQPKTGNADKTKRTQIEIIHEIAAIAVLHDQVDVLRRLLAVKQRDDILVVQLSQFLENFDFLLQKVLRPGKVLLGDPLYGHLLFGVLIWGEKKCDSAD